MKKQLPLLIAFCFSLHVANAQSLDFIFTVTNAPSLSDCSGSLDIQCANCPSPVNYSWYNYDDTIQTVIATGNQISGLCVGTSDFVFVNDNSCSNHLFVGLIGDTSKGNTFQTQIKLEYTSSSTAKLTIQNVFGGIGPYSYLLQDEYLTDLASNSFLPTISNLIIPNITFAYSGSHNELWINDSEGNAIGYYFNNVSDTNLCTTGITPLWASAQGNPVSDSSTCDGTAYTEVYGGTPPYTYQYSSGSTSDTAIGLCPGSYIVTIIDADSNIFNTSFVIGYPNTYYFSDGGSYTYLDTLYSNALQDCGIDYTLPVDTIYIDSTYALSNWEYVVNWTIVQDTNQFLFTETYFIDSTGYYYFGLSLYCDDVQRVSSNFASYTFFVGAYADISNSPTQIQDISLDNSIAVYPNPSNGIFTITASKKMTTYSIFDALGRKVASKTTDSTSQSIDIQSLNTGMYYLVVQLEDGTIGKQKLMKK